MRDGKIREHEVKPLELIWRKFPERYSAANTVHVDDLSRNFALNPQQGLKITAYKEPLRARGSDRELRSLAFYLVHIALHVPDFTTLSHGKWGTYVQDNVPESR
jgi:ubiquitin-like domain-containing CTD phosphatase 1